MISQSARTGFTILCLTAFFAVFAQSEQTFSLKEAQKDFSVFRGAFEEIHPGLYWHQSRESMDRQFDQARQSLYDGMTEGDLFQALAPVVSAMGCGHSSIWLSDETQERLNERWKFLPFELKFIGGKAYGRFHTAAQEGQKNPSAPGHQLLMINGQDIDSLVRAFLPLIPHDGYNTTFPYKWLEWQFANYHRILVGAADQYEVTYLDPQGQQQTILFQAQTQRQIAASREEKSDQHADILSMEYLAQHQTAILTVREFSNWSRNDKRVQFMKELQRHFEEMDASGTENLILDLRGNLGGSDVMGLELLSYLIDEPIQEFHKIESRAPKPTHLAYSDNSKLYYFKTKKVNDTTYHATGVRTLKPYGPSKPGFKGKLYVFINGLTFSTASDVAAQLQSRKRGYFIGQETGGGYSGNTSGSSIKIILPHSGLVCWVPIGRYYPNLPEPDMPGRGVFPDERLEPTIQDISAERDVHLERALQLIEAGGY